MTRALSVFSIIFLYASADLSQAQSGWVWQNPKPVGDGLGKVQFVSSTEGWITTDAGQLLHTTNGGANWSVVTPDSTVIILFLAQPAQAMSFINATTGWVIGTLGGFFNLSGPGLYRTTNGGVDWTPQGGIGAGLLGGAVQFLDASNGWATVGAGTFPDSLVGEIRRSTDGGETWSTIFNAFGTNNLPLAFTFKDLLNGWAVVDSLSGESVPPSRIMRTTDGGANWIQQYFDGTEGSLLDLQFTSLNDGWAVGESAKILRTTDGGGGWTPVTNAGISSFSRNAALFFVNADTGWIANDDFSGGHQILHTTDGGANWTTQNPGVNNDIFSLHFTDASNGWLSADFGQIAHTTDGGANWNLQSSTVTPVNLRGAAMLPGDLNDAWAAGEFGTILHTTDGGINWGFQFSGTSNHLNGVSFVDANTGYAVGDQIVLKTTDGGSNWNGVTPSSPVIFYAVNFVDANLGWVVGQYGLVYITTNGGGNWSTSNPGGGDLHGVYFDGSGNGWTVGDVGAIAWTSDGGASWTPQTSNTSQNLKAVDFVDAATGWAVGDSGKILHTTDGGANWVLQPSGMPNNLQAVFFIDADNGWVVGDGNLILRTTDGGTNWSREFGGTSFGGLKSASFSSANSGIAVGDRGAILHFGFTPTDVPGEKQHRPVSFALSQNYPNPFNPATTIRFSLPKRGPVRVEIYNLLGERVRILADQEFAAGEHSLVWDGRDEKSKTVSSGVYLYRLKGEEFSETKRMIFVK